MKRDSIIKHIPTAFALLLSLASCGDWLDINRNLNTAPEADADYLFNYAAVSASGSRQGGDSYIPISIGAQLLADGGFESQGGQWSEAQYSFSTYSFGNAWVGGYAGTLNNLTHAVKFATEDGDINTVAQCEILMAYAFYVLTMLYGDVPCAEALDVLKYPQPHFDSQKSVLEHSLSLLDHAISIATADGKGAISGYDIYFKGDMAKWVKTAKAFKLQILLTLYNREPERAAEIAKLVTAGGLPESGADDWKFPYFATAGIQNPNWRLNYNNTVDRIESKGASYYMFFAHNSVLAPMQEFNDPRIPVYFYANIDGEYRGLETGRDAEITGTANYQYLSSPINLKRFFTADMADVLMSYQETQFNLAEIYLKGIGVAKDAAKAGEAFLNGVKASCAFWGIPAADIATFAAGFPAFPSLGEEAALTLLNNQRWIDFMSRPFEAFNSQRRTKLPALKTPALAPADTFFNRYEYPTRESGSNPNVPSPLKRYYEPMWFQN